MIKNNPSGNTISQKMILFQKITIKNLVSLELRWSKFCLASLNTFWSIVGKTIKESLFGDQNRNAFRSEGMIKFHDNIALMTVSEGHTRSCWLPCGWYESFIHLFSTWCSQDKEIFEDWRYRSETSVRRDRKVQLCPEVVEALLSLRSLFKTLD